MSSDEIFQKIQFSLSLYKINIENQILNFFSCHSRKSELSNDILIAWEIFSSDAGVVHKKIF